MTPPETNDQFVDRLTTAFSLGTTVEAAHTHLDPDIQDQWQAVQAQADQQFQELIQNGMSSGLSPGVIFREILSRLGVAQEVNQAAAQYTLHTYREHHPDNSYQPHT